VSIGLSGVVNAVLFAFILHHPETKLLVFFFFPLPAWLFALLYVAYSFYEAKRGVGMVNHWAHLGGAMAGVIFAAFIKS
jgi:membrane associated rhomboid family serine protease